MTIQSDSATIGEKEISKRWPVEEGTTAATTKQVGAKFLHPEEDSLVLEKRRL